VVCAEVSGVVAGAKAVVVTISPVVSDLVEDSKVESSEVVCDASCVDVILLAADVEASADGRTVVEEAAVVSGMVRAVESADVATSSEVSSTVDGMAVVSELDEVS
jgi:hypothetical protein